MSNKESNSQDYGVDFDPNLPSESSSLSRFDDGYFLIQVLSCPNLSSEFRCAVESKLSKLLDKLT